MTSKKAPPKKGKKPAKVVPKAAPKKRPGKSAVITKPRPKRSRQSVDRSAKSRAKTRHGLLMAQAWYVARLIPAEGELPEVHTPSLADCALRAGVSLIRCEELSRQDGWVALRAAAQVNDEAEKLRVEEETRKALVAANNRLIQQVADQHARSRAAYFRTSMRGQSTIDRKLAEQEDRLDMQDLSAAMSALAKAQRITDLTVTGPLALLPKDVVPGVQFNQQLNVSWLTLTAPPNARVVAALAEADIMENPRR